MSCERKAAYMREWRKRNPEKCSAWKKRYYAANRDTILEQEKRRYENNKQQVIFRRKGERAASRGATVELTEDQWGFMLRWWGTACPYCNNCLPAFEATLDHVIPLALGGGHSMDNGVPCCHTCNSTKRHMPLEDWLSRCESRDGFFTAEQFRADLHQCTADWLSGETGRSA